MYGMHTQRSMTPTSQSSFIYFSMVLDYLDYRAFPLMLMGARTMAPSRGQHFYALATLFNCTKLLALYSHSDNMQPEKLNSAT